MPSVGADPSWDKLCVWESGFSNRAEEWAPLLPSFDTLFSLQLFAVPGWLQSLRTKMHVCILAIQYSQQFSLEMYNLPASSRWLALYKNCDTSSFLTLPCYWLVLFSTIKSSRATFEKDILVPTNTYKNIEHSSLSDLIKSWFKQSLLSQQPRSAVSGALTWWLRVAGHHRWHLLCRLYNTACYIICAATFLPLTTFLAASWDELGDQLEWTGVSRCRAGGKDSWSILLSRGMQEHTLCEHFKPHCSLSLNPDQSAEVLDFF